jgi:endonuclease YncB( thermonuclease family)
MRMLPLILSGILFGSAQAATLEGRVVGVLDGDTVTLLESGRTQHRVRLAHIDAPEKGQPFGAASKGSLSSLIFGKEVKADCPETDRYGRKVCVLLLPDGTNVNLEQVRRGMAWHYERYSRDAAYAEAEVRARQQRVGLWAERSPTPPWEWRRGK